ncbi:MAG TPA: MBG domain-containing protein, partial [Nitrospirota bacterium]|nr:MBG domain-containing protein [Nitrospirota bacterium]
ATSVTWANPSAITYGTALSGTQLNATPSVAGNLVYTPASGTILNAGTNQTLSVTFTPNDTANYTGSSANVQITVATRPITVTADAKTKVYGAVDPALTYQITSGSLVGSDTLSGALTRAAGENVGNYAIQLGSLTNSNYQITFVSANLSITAKPITVTADAKTKVYGASDPAFTYTTSGLVGSDTLSGALTRVTGEAIGTYAIQQGSLANSNYQITFNTANLTITVRPITVTADAKTKTYGASDPALTYTITSGSLAGSDTLSGALTRVAGETVGTYAIQQGSLSAGSNYALTYVGANLSITARLITVSADAKSKVFGASDPALTYTITSGSLINGDSFTGALTRVGGENVGTYAIQQGSLSAGINYVITYNGANLTITKADQTITFSLQSTATVGDPPITLTATASSGLAVTYSSDNTDVAAISGNTVVIMGAGTANITASQAGNGNYNAAPNVVQPLNVSGP